MENEKNKTIEADTVCVNRKELTKILGCGQYTADRIARKSGARIEVGRRVLIYLPKLREYLSEITETK